MHILGCYNSQVLTWAAGDKVWEESSGCVEQVAEEKRIILVCVTNRTPVEDAVRNIAKNWNYPSF